MGFLKFKLIWLYFAFLSRIEFAPPGFIVYRRYSGRGRKQSIYFENTYICICVDLGQSKQFIYVYSVYLGHPPPSISYSSSKYFTFLESYRQSSVFLGFGSWDIFLLKIIIFIIITYIRIIKNNYL